MKTLFLPLSFALLSVPLVACSSSSVPGTTGQDSGSGPSDAGRDQASDAPSMKDAGHEAGPKGYPAFPVDVPQVQKNKDAILKNPVIVTITWPGDTHAPIYEAFGDKIGASSFWSATTAEYGVGAAKSGPGNHVRMTQPLPMTLSYNDLITFVTDALMAAGGDAGAPDSGPPDGGSADGGEAGGPNPTWPAPTLDGSGNVETVYSLFIPVSTAVTDPGSGLSFCVEGANGYHDDIVIGGKPYPYSVSLECPSEAIDGIEEEASHEYVEAATDPYPSSTDLGYVTLDADHLAWDLFTGFSGDEVADMCQNWADSYVQDKESAFPYWVQRSWSNKEAALGHAPCLPAPPGAYYGLTLLPSEEESVTVDLTKIGAGPTKTLGFKASAGKPLTFHVGFFSDAAAPAWSIAYDFPTTTLLFDTSFNPIGNGAANVKLDKMSGQNGDKATVTVDITQKGPAGFHVMAITWDPPAGMMYLPHYVPIVIVDE